MKLFVVVQGETFPRGNAYNYKHIRAYESQKRAENYAKKLEGANVLEFVPKDTSLREDPYTWSWEELDNHLAIFDHFDVTFFDGGEHKIFSGDSGVSVLRVTDVSPQKGIGNKVLLHISTDANFFTKERNRIFSDSYIKQIIEDQPDLTLSQQEALLKSFKIGVPPTGEPFIASRD